MPSGHILMPRSNNSMDVRRGHVMKMKFSVDEILIGWRQKLAIIQSTRRGY